MQEESSVTLSRAMRSVAVAVLFLASCGVEQDLESVVEQGTTVCGDSPVVQGIDVSKLPVIDTVGPEGRGVEFAFIRVSDGLTHPDAKFAPYWEGARAANVLRGAYQYFRPSQDPIAQAEMLLGAIGQQLPMIAAGDRCRDQRRTRTERGRGRRPGMGRTVTTAIGRPPIIYPAITRGRTTLGTRI